MGYERFFAAVYDSFMKGAEERIFREYRSFVAGETRGRVVEIGAGTGANLPFYPRDVAPVLTEPNPYMLKRLRGRATSLGIPVQSFQQPAEHLEFPDGSFDVAVVTLALCSVADLSKALGEIHRVLAPGGELRFIEHVRSTSSFWARCQDAATPIWKHIGAGCHPNRDTLAAMQDAGFEIMEVCDFKAGPYPIRPFVAGVARRSAAPAKGG